MSDKVHVTIPLTAAEAGDVFSTPEYQAALQQVVQETVLRYAQLSAEPKDDDGE